MDSKLQTMLRTGILKSTGHKIKEINYKYTICGFEVLVFQFSVLFFSKDLILFMNLDVTITFALKKHHSEPTLAVPEARSAGTTKCSIDLLSSTKQGNFMESFMFYISFWT